MTAARRRAVPVVAGARTASSSAAVLMVSLPRTSASTFYARGLARVSSQDICTPSLVNRLVRHMFLYQQSAAKSETRVKRCPQEYFEVGREHAR